jgi:hypothetical protein
MGPVPHQIVCQFSLIGIISSDFASFLFFFVFFVYSSELQPDVYILNSAVVAL